MKTVTFVREYRHRLTPLQEAVYPVGEMEVSNEVAIAARNAGALKKEATARAKRPDQGK